MILFQIDQQPISSSLLIIKQHKKYGEHMKVGFDPTVCLAPYGRLKILDLMK